MWAWPSATTTTMVTTDIFVAGVYREPRYTTTNGDGTFTDVTGKAGLALPDKQYGPLWSVAAAWVDINNDGLLDLFVVNYLSWDGSKEPDCEYNGKPSIAIEIHEGPCS